MVTITRIGLVLLGQDETFGSASNGVRTFFL
jgi:hypothetical protein